MKCKQPATSVAFGPDGTHVASADGSGAITTWVAYRPGVGL